jgi:hypothetical protein
LIPILLDPWLIEFSPETSDDDMNIQTDALRLVFSDLKIRYPLEILPFIGPDQQAEFWGKLARYQAADRGEIARWIVALSLDDEPNIGPAAFTDFPCPDLSKNELWLKVLAITGNTDEPPAWRYPMLLRPDIRKPSWPDADEINYTHEDSPKKRNLVPIEHHRDHKFFITDIDPWRLGCVGEPRSDAPVDEMTTTCRRLPRPPSLRLIIPLSQLAELARKINDCTCGRDKHYYYLPPLSWQPTDRKRDDWRKYAFDRDGVVLKKGRRKETGYRDRNDHIWVWDESEPNHWDVKTAGDIRIAKVRYDGLKKSPS